MSLWAVQYGYTGYIADNETGLLHARARQFNTFQGRFIGRDPLGYIDGTSLYTAYFVPLASDPSGLAGAQWNPAPQGPGRGIVDVLWTPMVQALSDVVEWAKNQQDGPFNTQDAVPGAEIKIGLQSIGAAASAIGIKCPCCKNGQPKHYVSANVGVGARVTAGSFFSVPLLHSTIEDLNNNPFGSCPSTVGDCPDDEAPRSPGVRVIIGMDFGFLIAFHGFTSYSYSLSQATAARVDGEFHQTNINVGIQAGAQIWAQIEATGDITKTF